MKKFFTFITAFITVLALHATDYTTPMAIDVDGELAPQGNVVITLDKADIGYDLTIRNFIFALGPDETMPIGNICAKGIEGTEEDGVISLKADALATVTNGDLAGVSFWMGPMLLAKGVDLSVDLKAEGEALEGKFAMNVLNQNVVVFVGEKTIAEGATGIGAILTPSATVVATYDITGKVVKNTIPGNIYIRKFSDGRAIKFFAK